MLNSLVRFVSGSAGLVALPLAAVTALFVSTVAGSTSPSMASLRSGGGSCCAGLLCADCRNGCCDCAAGCACCAGGACTCGDNCGCVCGSCQRGTAAAVSTASKDCCSQANSACQVTKVESAVSQAKVADGCCGGTACSACTAQSCAGCSEQCCDCVAGCACCANGECSCGEACNCACCKAG